MEIINGLTHFPQALDYPVMTIGVFDGVHRGHQFILQQLAKRAQMKGGTAVLLTFTPHPQKIISPAKAPLLLQTKQQKGQMLETLGVDILLRLPFTRRLSLYSPSEFAHQVLHNHGIREIHVGGNFRFGHRRSGDIQTLMSLGEKYQFEVYEIDPVYYRGARISSSFIRNLLKEGRVALAKRLLGRPYQIEGIVVRGSGKGVQLGFPTANLDPENELIPTTGVYVTRAHVNGKVYPSVTNIGYRPTLHQQFAQKPVVEPHLLGFDENIYGKPIKLDFCFRLRAEKKFENVQELQKQIGKDVNRTRKYERRVEKILARISHTRSTASAR
ncbi:bifunctional riboflavin kinase/FAD synthetase [Acidobacteria bacterium AH-259-D05]|nr:bifunctional riboflavin kinase/FAD synthetase [Acidobacteria bacterium AH-259-D05]